MSDFRWNQSSAAGPFNTARSNAIQCIDSGVDGFCPKFSAEFSAQQ